jgi:hypothetical protein
MEKKLICQFEAAPKAPPAKPVKLEADGAGELTVEFDQTAYVEVLKLLECFRQNVPIRFKVERV